MRQGRFITTAVAVVAAMAIGATGAAAAPLSFVDDTALHFGAGTPGTATSVTDAPGSVRLKRTMKTEPFNGPNLPASMEHVQWAPPAGTAAVDVLTGMLNVDGERVTDTRFYDPGQTLEFRATFSPTAPAQHVGFGNTLEAGPWAIISTGGGGSGLDLQVSTQPVQGASESSAMVESIPGVDKSIPHTYRIEWSAAEVRYYVDDILRRTHNLAAALPTPLPPFTNQLRPIISDAAADAAQVSIDSLGMSLFPNSGAFESQVFNAGDARGVWDTLSSTGVGTGITFETRSGKTGNPNDGSWSAYQSLGTNGAIQSPSGQFIQYRATLSTGDDRVTPSLDSVTIGYDIDNTLPSATIDGVQVSGTTANVTFSSADLDKAAFVCSLDGGAFGPCTSPKAFTGLAAGSHTATVRAIDKVGNIGTPVSKTFSIASSSSGGATQGSSGASGTAADKTSPKVSLVAKSLRASKRGTVSFRVKCPATEKSCKITVKLMNGKKVAAKKTVTVAGGKTATVTLQLAKAIRKQLRSHGSLKVSAVTTASDAAGNKRTAKQSMTLRAPKA
jgi:hypothetical protein